MKMPAMLATLGLTLATGVSDAQEVGFMLTMTVEKDGQVLAQPRLVTRDGTQATIQKDQDLKIEVTPASKGETIDLAMKLYLRGPNGLAIAASPRLITKAETPSTFVFQAPGEPHYKISLVATNHAIGAPLPVSE